MELLVYSDAQQLGGAEMNLGLILGALDPDVDVRLLGVDQTVVDWLVAARPGTRGETIAPIENRGDLAGMAAHRRRFKAIAADIIHFNLSTMSSCQWAMVAAASLRGVRITAVENSPMGTWSDRSTQIKQFTSARLARHAAVGQRTARLVEQEGNLPVGSVGTLYPGVDPTEHHPPARTDDAVVVGTVARMDRVKGIDILIDAMSDVSGDARLVLIGGGAEKDAMVERVDERGLNDRVEFRNVPWDERARDHLAGFDIFVLPSRLEGFPVTIMEAMLAGVPVVASDVGSVRESVTDGVTGRIVPPNSPEALAAAINDLIDNPVERKAMGAAGLATAERRFTISAAAARYMDMFRSVVASPPPPLSGGVIALLRAVVDGRRR